MSNVTFAVVYFCESRERLFFFPTLTTRKHIELESPRFLHHPAGSILGAPEEIVRPRDRLVKVGAKPISILVGFQNGVPKIWENHQIINFNRVFLINHHFGVPLFLETRKKESPLVGFGVGSLWSSKWSSSCLV